MKNKIFKIVKNHFSLDKPSLDKFEKLLFNPDIDEVYKEIVDNDFRYKVEIPNVNLMGFDKGWYYFKKDFNDFIVHHKIQYEDFKKSRVWINKNEYRLFKLLKSYYMKEENREKLPLPCYCNGCCESYLNEQIEKIGAYKIPNKKLHIVLSLNFVDWFLCATGETWTSCLNVESNFGGCYWSGLPGLIGDKNRAMIYITDEKKKAYNGMVVERFLSRSWVLLDEYNKINYLKFYPTRYINPEEIKEHTKLDIQYITPNFISKHPVDLLFHKNKESCFAFQDNTYIKSDLKMYWSSSNMMQIFDKNQEHFDNTSIIYHDGLLRLIEVEKEINDFVHKRRRCYACERNLIEGDFYTGCNGNSYCPDCFFDTFEICQTCNETFYKEDICFTHDGPYCRKCFDKYFFICAKCGETRDRGDSYGKNNDLCEDCFVDLYTPCDSCCKDFPQSEIRKAPDGETFLCAKCYEEYVKVCCECEKEMMIEDVIPFSDLNLYICKKCQEKKNISQ